MSDAQSLLASIVEVAERLEIEVREAPLGGEGGGLCKLRGQHVLFIDTMADLATMADKCLAAIAQLPELDTVFIVPELREAIEKVRGG